MLYIFYLNLVDSTELKDKQTYFYHLNLCNSAEIALNELAEVESDLEIILGILKTFQTRVLNFY